MSVCGIRNRFQRVRVLINSSCSGVFSRDTGHCCGFRKLLSLPEIMIPGRLMKMDGGGVL